MKRNRIILLSSFIVAVTVASTVGYAMLSSNVNAISSPTRFAYTAKWICHVPLDPTAPASPLQASVSPQTGPDFNMTLSQTFLTIPSGTCATKVLTVVGNGFNQTVCFTSTVIGGPGATVTISPSCVTLPPFTAASVTITVCISPGTPPGSFTVVITATNGSVSHSITEADIVPGPTQDFGIILSPSNITLAKGQCFTKTILITSIGNFSGTVSLTVTAPLGFTCTLSQASVTLPPGGSATVVLSCCVSPTITPGFYTIVVTGTSGPITHSTAETDTVLAPTFNPSNAEQIGLVPGEYKTDINVHNPSFATSNLTITKKFVLSVAEQPVVIKTPFKVTQTVLGPDAAMFITCDEIFSILGLQLGTPAKGFVELITTTPNLNVVAEYSAESFNAPTVPPGVPSGISLSVQTIPSAPFVP